MQIYKKGLDYLEKVCLTIAAVLFIVIFFVSVTEIILRNGFRYSLLWSQDLCNLLTCWTMMLGAAALIHRGDHLVVDFLVRIFPQKAQTLMLLVTRLVLLYFCSVLGVHGIIVVRVKMGLYYTSLRWPTGFAYMSLPVFGTVSALFLIDKIIDTVKALLKKEGPKTAE